MLLMDTVSTENCIFRNSDPKIVAVVGSGIQVLLMTILLVVHLCTFSGKMRMVMAGGMFISSTPFFSKENQDYAELASRIGYLPQSLKCLIPAT